MLMQLSMRLACQRHPEPRHSTYPIRISNYWVFKHSITVWASVKWTSLMSLHCLSFIAKSNRLCYCVIISGKEKQCSCNFQLGHKLPPDVLLPRLACQLNCSRRSSCYLARKWEKMALMWHWWVTLWNCRYSDSNLHRCTWNRRACRRRSYRGWDCSRCPWADRVFSRRTCEH